MSNEKERNLLLNLNRLLIYSFGLLGLYFDNNLAYVISMTLWVWLPLCIRYEKYILAQWRKHPIVALIKSNHPDSHP